MSNNGKYKITVESCILLILLIITSCIYTAKLSQSSDDINADIGKDSIVQEEKKKQRSKVAEVDENQLSIFDFAA